jgi:DNA-directed RNA polymerase subunit RPC12/RpoP
VLNPGYKTKVQKEKFYVNDPGQVIYCPNCKRIIGEAVIDRLYTRCKHCGWWVYVVREGSSKIS